MGGGGMWEVGGGKSRYHRIVRNAKHVIREKEEGKACNSWTKTLPRQA